MRVLSKKRIVSLGLVAVLVLATTACDAVGVGEQAPFKIGVMESVTGPGETYGTVAVQAKQMAVDEINAAGGINGRMLELIVEDSKCNAQDSITAYNKLTDVDGVKIILGTSCSGAMLGAAPLAEEDGVVLFSAVATNPDIANAGDYIFRTAMSDAQVGIDAGNVLWADGVRKLSTITETTDYAEGVRRTTVAQFEKRGGKVVAAERYGTDATDFRTQLTKLFNDEPDALHVASQSEFAGGTIVKQARELGYEGPIYSDIIPVGLQPLRSPATPATGMKAVWQTLILPTPQHRKFLLTQGALRICHAALVPRFCLRRRIHGRRVFEEDYDDQDADGFRDCLYEITWSGAIGDNYSFDEDGEVVGLSNVVVEILPAAERTADNQGYKVLGGAPTE